MMRNLAKAALGRLLKMPRRLVAARGLARLRPVSPPLAEALSAAAAGRMNAEERDWVCKIEALRSEMEASSEKIDFIDYGAGSPGQQPAPEEMARGRPAAATVGEICRSASKPPYPALVLFRLVREFKPLSCLELGTSLGISACYQAAGLALNGAGSLVSLEGAAALADRALRNLARLGLGQATVVTGRFQDTLTCVLRERGPFDYAFIDGHHDEAATIGYFAAILPVVRQGGLLVFDDIDWSRGMRRAWQAICNDQRAAIAVDLGGMGLVLPGDRRLAAAPFHIPLF